MAAVAAAADTIEDERASGDADTTHVSLNSDDGGATVSVATTTTMVQQTHKAAALLVVASQAPLPLGTTPALRALRKLTPRPLPTPVATPHTSPHLHVTVANNGGAVASHASPARRTQQRTPSPRQQAETLSRMGTVYGAILAATPHAHLVQHNNSNSTPTHRVATAVTPPPATSPVARALPSHHGSRQTNAVTAQSRRPSSSPAAATVTFATVADAATALQAARERVVGSAQRPRPDATSSPAPLPTTKAASSESRPPSAPRSSSGFRQPRPLPTFDLCMCTSPEAGRRLRDAVDTTPPPVDAREGYTTQRTPAGTILSFATPRPLPTIAGAVHPDLEELLPREILHGAMKLFLQRKAWARWRRRLALALQATLVRQTVARRHLRVWQQRAMESKKSNELRMVAVQRQHLRLWRQKLREAYAARLATQAHEQYVCRKVLVSWWEALQRRRMLAAGTSAPPAVVVRACFAAWRAKASERMRLNAFLKRARFQRWRRHAALRRSLRRLNLRGLKYLCAWRLASAQANSPRVKLLEKMENHSAHLLQLAAWRRWTAVVARERHMGQVLEMNALRLGRRRLRSAWHRWCDQAAAKRFARRKALLMRLADHAAA